jgi:hypothetical protein
MKKRVLILIKGILLGLIFVLTFNLSLSQLFLISGSTPIAFAQTSDIDKSLEGVVSGTASREADLELAKPSDQGSAVKTSEESQAAIDAAMLTPEQLQEQQNLAAQGGKTDERVAEDARAEQAETQNAAAQTEAAPKAPSKSELMQNAINTVARVGFYTHMIFHPLINFFAFHTGNFLGNDYIYQGAMGDMLKRIWIVSRNVVNIIFVLLLLGMALKEIFWLKEEGSNLKKNLIVFALMLVAVNFSWMATKVVLDAANVATNVVFSIPMGVSSAGLDITQFQQCDVVPCTGDEKCTTKTTGLCYPTAIYLPLDAEAKDYQYVKEADCGGIAEKYSGADDSAFDNKGELNKTIIGQNPANPNEKYQKLATYCWGTIDFFKYNKNTTTIYLTYGMARIQNLVNSTSTENIVQLSVGILFSLFLQIAYSAALLALFIALIVRMAMLWLFVAFSPFLMVMFFISKAGVNLPDESKNLSIAEFIRWAFVPVKVAAVFSVAFLMVTAGQALTEKNPNFLEQIGGAAQASGKLFRFNALFMGMDGIQQFIWFLITLIVLWMGVFSVLGKMPGVSMITSQIDGYGKRAGKWIASTPYWAPIMPMVDSTGAVKLGSFKRDIAQKIDIAGKLEEQGRKIIQGDETAALYKKARGLGDGDRDRLIGLWGENRGNSSKAAEFLSKFDLTLNKWRDLPEKVKKELLNVSGGKISEKSGDIYSWLEGYAKYAGKPETPAKPEVKPPLQQSAVSPPAAADTTPGPLPEAKPPKK